MFPLLRQIQAVCDQVKYAAGRTAGKDQPSHPDTEQTIDELRARLTQLAQHMAADVAGAAG
jgi:hypothetical protein